MALGSTRDQAFLRSFGSPPPVIRPDVGASNLGHTISNWGVAMAARYGYGNPTQYIDMNEEISKSYIVNPTNQGQRGGIAARESLMFDPRNNPSRSQMNQGYTDPLQKFASFSTWAGSAGATSRGKRARQPNPKFVSPFRNNPLPTRMPWDL